MKVKFLADRARVRRLYLLLPWLISFSLALLSGAWLLNKGAMDQLVSFIINVGLDQLRAQLTSALILIMVAGLIGALVGRRRLAAIVGAGMAFWFNYLAPFIQLELRPVYDPGGHLEPLDMNALVHTSFVMMSLALLSSFLGAATGAALGEVLLDPPYRLLRLLWQRLRSSRANNVAGSDIADVSTAPSLDVVRATPTLGQIVVSWLGTILMVVLLVGASGATPLFIFTPDVGLHLAPSLGRATGTVVDDALVSPALKGQKRAFLVYLPPSYNTPKGKTKRYPVLYMLHGAPGTPNDWIKGGKAVESADTLIDTGKIPELIMVFPDGNGKPKQTSEWADSIDGQQLIETYVARDLVSYVDHHYRTIPDAAHRAIAGLSMGGFGAMNIAIHHPTTFGTVISLGGYYIAERHALVFGLNPAYQRKNSPLYVLPHDKAAWKLHMYLGAATDDQPYYNFTKQYIQVLNKYHVSYHFDLMPGSHSWHIWPVQMYHALAWIKWG